MSVMAWNRLAWTWRGLAWAVLATAPIVAATEARSETGTVPPGARVRWRIASQGEAWHAGRFAMAREDTLFLIASTRETLAVAGSVLSRFEVSRGRRAHWRTGAWIGGVTAIGLSLVFLGLGSIDEGHAPGASDLSAVLTFGAIGAGAGLVVGGLVRTERWEAVPDAGASIPGSSESPVFAIRVSHSW